MTKTEIARQYREKYPDFPTKKLSRIVYKEHKLLFKDEENVRFVLRYIEGKTGKVKAAKKSDILKTEARPYNPYNLPKSDESKYTPFVIKGYKKVGIMNDIHLPYHSMEAVTTAIQHLKKEKIDALLLNGDIIDCHRLSNFAKDSNKRDFKYEIDTLKSFFDVIEKQLKCKVFFKIGNHEERYERFLFEKAKEIAGIDEIQFANIIKARERGIDIIESNRYMKLNELNGIHGHEYKGGISTPVNIARGLYNKGKVSAFQGHNHATSEHTEPNMDGKVTTTWSVGCLSELHPEYMPLNKWNHGFAFVNLDANGIDFEFHNKRIFKGKVL